MASGGAAAAAAAAAEEREAGREARPKSMGKVAAAFSPRNPYLAKVRGTLNHHVLEHISDRFIQMC
jgi:hypothetical protein